MTDDEPAYTGDIMVVCNECSHEWVLNDGSDIWVMACPGCGAVENYSVWDENGER